VQHAQRAAAPAPYAETRACLEARARSVPTDAETPWDEDLGDAFVELIGSSGQTGSATTTSATPSPYVVVVHVPLAALVEESGEESALAGEFERDGLIDFRSVRQLACDATVVIALDDDVGHTMYEGRARRTPNAAQRREVVRRDRHCRFPAAPTSPSPMSTTSCPGDPAHARTSTISRSCACTTITWCIRRGGR
jgi:hypothetical protein